MSEINYQEAYEREHEKCADLADKIVVLESEKEDLQFKLDRIKKNKFWKATGPARSLIHFAQRQRDRLSHCGGPKDILRKIRNKSRQKSLMESYGTGSFPDADQRKKEEETIFPYMPKISILVPLWNNKREFQIQMLDCVMNQTYPNWELCLADGSGAEHSYIGDLCREYAAKANGRIVYKHLDHNGGISYNTNECYKLATGDYIGLFDQDDILHPSVLYAYVKEINEQGADYLYCDETTFKENDINKMLTMHFKPDYAPDNLRANNYICHFSVFDLVNSTVTVADLDSVSDLVTDIRGFFIRSLGHIRRGIALFDIHAIVLVLVNVGFLAVRSGHITVRTLGNSGVVDRLIVHIAVDFCLESDGYGLASSNITEVYGQRTVLYGMGSSYIVHIDAALNKGHTGRDFIGQHDTFPCGTCLFIV